MKKKEFQEFKNKPVAELQKEVRAWRERLHAMQFDLAAGKVKNIKEIQSLKKGIAQMLTLLHQK